MTVPARVLGLEDEIRLPSFLVQVEKGARCAFVAWHTASSRGPALTRLPASMLGSSRCRRKSAADGLLPDMGVDLGRDRLRLLGAEWRRRQTGV